ncbi:ras-related protein Rab-28-like [Venturia canescens]|uniref:ras-related protein Rab-28-like n=1 Tax=Venturia canescens TaxID=32260 RepID=UPI001C9C5B93|nr:ras-related protein Rab-28-like [Venturia canescens]
MFNPDEDLTEKRLKVVLVGDSAAGKTSIAVKFCNDEFSRQYTPTAGIDFFTKSLSLGFRRNVNLQLWDVGGLALRGSMLDKYIYRADVILLVYDVTNSSSFDILDEWISSVNEIFESSSVHKKPLMVMVGNKCDVEHQRTVKREKSHRFAAENGFSYYDMSARTGESVSLCIANVAAKVLGVQLTRMDQDLHKPIVIAEIGDTVDISSIQRVVKRYPNKKAFQLNGNSSLPISRSAVCCLQ